MELIYEQTLTITENLVDRYGRAKPSVLLYCMQEAAGQHCKLLGADHSVLSEKNLFWAVTRSRVQITRLPRLGEQIHLKTWPMPTTRVAYPRCVTAFGRDGRELFNAVSLWVLMDSDTRAMVLPGKSGVDVPGILTGTEPAQPRAIPVKPMERTVQRTVGYTLLDRNGHMNNTKYMDWIDDLLPSAFHREHSLAEFTVCYLSETREGQELTLCWDFLEDGEVQVDAYRQTEEKQERVFSSRLLFD